MMKGCLSVKKRPLRHIIASRDRAEVTMRIDKEIESPLLSTTSRLGILHKILYTFSFIEIGQAKNQINFYLALIAAVRSFLVRLLAQRHAPGAQCGIGMIDPG